MLQRLHGHCESQFVTGDDDDDCDDFDKAYDDDEDRMQKTIVI